MNSDKKIYNHINNNIIEENEINDNEKILLDILSNANKYNNKKSKIKSQKDYKILIKTFSNINQNGFINTFKYFNSINIPILKVIISGFIEFQIDDEINEQNILEIISKCINICFNKNLFYFVYKKLSKYFRRHKQIKDIDSIKKFKKLFKVWKLLYDISNPKLSTDLINSSSFLLFSNLEESKNYINIFIDDYNEMQNLIITFNFVPSPISNINKINDKLSFIKLFGEKGETFELKYKDINLNNSEKFSEICQLKFDFSLKGYDIYINEKLKISKNEVTFKFNSVKKIELLNNYFGIVSSIILEKKYSIIPEYSFSIQPIKIEIFKESLSEEIKIKTNAFKVPSDNLDDMVENKVKIFPYQYCGASYIIHINSDNIQNEEKNWKKGNVDLNDIEYFGGLNSFIPLFKIIKYILDKLESFSNNKNNQEENEKLKITSDIQTYINEIFSWFKEILKIMIKMICLSENNYKNFKKIIIPLIGAIAEIYHSLNTLCSSNLISNKQISLLFNDEIFSSLYIIILISSFPCNVKEMYRKIVGINKNLDNLIIPTDSFIFDIEKNQIKNIDWYFLILVMYCEFIFIYFNSTEKVPINIINQSKSILYKDLDNNNDEIIEKQNAIKMLYIVMSNFYNEKNNNNLENLIRKKTFKNDNDYYFKFIIYILTTSLNIKSLLKENKIDFNKESFYEKFIKLVENYIKNKEKMNITDDLVQLIINYKLFPEEFDFINQLFPFLTKENFNSSSELIMDELIDYNGEYHHLMKELFIFNKLWSNQKLFFKNTLNEIKESKLKYKNINYYTRNFQRPILYPILDYKYRYPKFSDYTINNDFYLLKEDSDDYCFDLDCPELDKFIEEYNKDIFKKIDENGKINSCNVCLVKQTHHVKGNLFIISGDDKIIIYFYSHPYEIQNNEGEKFCCNKDKEDKINKIGRTLVEKEHDNLCYGSIFKCPKKDANKKIKIEFEHIRLVLSRIYFYRDSALEIFTETKSYFFNFFSNGKKNSVIDTFLYPSQKSYFPINIGGNRIGYMKLNSKIIDKNKFSNLIEMDNNLINLFTEQTSKGGLWEMCNFDIIMIINLLSNRSFNDLYQYPIFPVLYLCDKENNEITRDFKEHIGFQEISNSSRQRKNLILEIYDQSVNEFDEEFNPRTDLRYCFNTHYSNCVYTSNFLIRLFPYSFIAIEFQGNGFDDPNRLFFSIESALYSISSNKSDLRELIPEFFYLPEMFMNINSINFHERTNKELVDDVIMPKEIKDKIFNDNDNIIIENKNSSDFNIITNNKDYDYKEYYIYVEVLKNKLEKLAKDLGLWINIIFGLGQKNSTKNHQYFRRESYFDNKGLYNDYIKDDLVMNSVEFGIVPLQSIYDYKIISNLQKRKSSEYENHQYRDTNKINTKLKKMKNDAKKIINNLKCCIEKNEEYIERNIFIKNTDNYFNNEFNDYWDENLNIIFKINNDNNFGKLEISKNSIFINEVSDHNNKITDFYYNRRLNMFATTSEDGFICIYILPCKLFSMIKHPKNGIFDKIFLSANPFPTIIAYDKKESTIISYSLVGLLIKKVKIIKNEFNEIEITPIFNIYGGAFKDKIKITTKYEEKVNYKFYNLPFFEKEYEEEELNEII